MSSNLTHSEEREYAIDMSATTYKQRLPLLTLLLRNGQPIYSESMVLDEDIIIGDGDLFFFDGIDWALGDYSVAHNLTKISMGDFILKFTKSPLESIY